MTRGKNYEVIWNLSRNRPATGHFRNLDDDYPIVRPGSGERTILPEIEKHLGLDKNIFMNAIYVRQGEIAKLIDAKPSERKKLIGEILGIEELEKIWDAMREPIRNLENELEGYKRDVEQLSKYERELKEKEKELSEKHEQYQKKREELDKLEEKLKSLENEVKELDNKAKIYRKIMEEIGNLRNQKQEKELNRRQLVEKITELESALSELKECEPYYKISIKKENELRSINEKKRELEEKINEKLELERKKSSLEERIRALSERINEKLQFFEKITNIKLADIGQLKRFYERARHTIKEKEIKIVKEMTERINEKQKYAKMGSLLSIIAATSTILLIFLIGLSVPTIISALAIIFSFIFVLRKLSKKQKYLEATIIHLQQRLQDLMYIKRNLDEFNISEVMNYYQELKMHEVEISRLEEEIKILRDLKSQRGFLEQEILGIEEELNGLKQYVNRYVQAQSILKREGLKSIQELEKHVEQLKSHKLMMDRESAELDEKINRLEEEMEKLSYNEEIHQDKRREYESLLKERSDIHGDVREIEVEIKKLSERIKDLKEEINRLQSSREKCEKLEQFVNSLKKIRDLFYRDGPLQNSIRSDAAMRIENNARKLLQEFNLPFIDVSVDKDFNIVVYGRDGVQTLDTLSGGEKVAVALVIRLAIAAALTGEALELMIMDEPTIHLDTDRRRELVNLLKNFRKGGHMISQLIIVSHDRELEEAANVVYEVVREGGVSKIKRQAEISSAEENV